MTAQSPYPALTPEEIPAFKKAIAEALSDSNPLVSQEEMAEIFRQAQKKVAKAICELENSYCHAS